MVGEVTNGAGMEWCGGRWWSRARRTGPNKCNAQRVEVHVPIGSACGNELSRLCKTYVKHFPFLEPRARGGNSKAVKMRNAVTCIDNTTISKTWKDRYMYSG